MSAATPSGWRATSTAASPPSSPKEGGMDMAGSKAYLARDRRYVRDVY
jgi:hypothetical protein